MDQSIEYVKMCNCHEIQKAEHLESHNFYYHGFLADDKMQDVFLRRIDQLIEILVDVPFEMAYRGQENGYITRKLRVPGYIHPVPVHCYAPTAEQALLQLVMSELHGKKWNGEEWIK